MSGREVGAAAPRDDGKKPPARRGFPPSSARPMAVGWTVPAPGAAFVASRLPRSRRRTPAQHVNCPPAYSGCRPVGGNAHHRLSRRPTPNALPFVLLTRASPGRVRGRDRRKSSRRRTRRTRSALSRYTVEFGSASMTSPRRGHAHLPAFRTRVYADAREDATDPPVVAPMQSSARKPPRGYPRRVPAVAIPVSCPPAPTSERGWPARVLNSSHVERGGRRTARRPPRRHRSRIRFPGTALSVSARRARAVQPADLGDRRPQNPRPERSSARTGASGSGCHARLTDRQRVREVARRGRRAQLLKKPPMNHRPAPSDSTAHTARRVWKSWSTTLGSIRTNVRSLPPPAHRSREVGRAARTLRLDRRCPR